MEGVALLRLSGLGCLGCRAFGLRFWSGVEGVWIALDQGRGCGLRARVRLEFEGL